MVVPEKQVWILVLGDMGNWRLFPILRSWSSLQVRCSSLFKDFLVEHLFGVVGTLVRINLRTKCTSV